MSSKLWCLALTLFLIITISGIVNGKASGSASESPKSELQLDLPIPPSQSAMSTAPKLPSSPIIPYGEGRPNLIIGGIRQKGPDSAENPDYVNFANDNNATYVPTYYTGNDITDALQVQNTAAAIPIRTYENGLLDPELNNQHYTTIISYSGGTRSAVTALCIQGVTADTLVLISPMKGAMTQTTYDQEIQEILNNGTVKQIVVLQSPDDKPSASFLGYQAKFSSTSGVGKNPRIKVINLSLTQQGPAGHIEMEKYIAHDLWSQYVIINQPAAVAALRQVTLVIYVTEGDINGNRLSGVQVTGQDAVGKSFTGTTDSNGVMIISGMPGTWQLTLSKEGYDTRKINYDVTKTENGAVYIERSTPVAVALTLDLEGADGEPLPDAQVAVQDASGNSVQGRTDSNGVVTISAQPGTWQLTLSKEGYDTESIRFDVTKTLKAFVTLTRTAQSVQPAQGSENSIVGKWNAVWEYPIQTMQFVIIFNTDGTFNRPEVYHTNPDYGMHATTGRWTQNGDRVSWTDSSAYGRLGRTLWNSNTELSFVGTAHMNSMNGNCMAGNSNGGSWSAERIGD